MKTGFETGFQSKVLEKSRSFLCKPVLDPLKLVLKLVTTGQYCKVLENVAGAKRRRNILGRSDPWEGDPQNFKLLLLLMIFVNPDETTEETVSFLSVLRHHSTAMKQTERNSNGYAISISLHWLMTHAKGPWLKWSKRQKFSSWKGKGVSWNVCLSVDRIFSIHFFLLSARLNTSRDKKIVLQYRKRERGKKVKKFFF